MFILEYIRKRGCSFVGWYGFKYLWQVIAFYRECWTQAMGDKIYEPNI